LGHIYDGFGLSAYGIVTGQREGRSPTHLMTGHTLLLQDIGYIIEKYDIAQFYFWVIGGAAGTQYQQREDDNGPY